MQKWVVEQMNRAMILYIILLAIGNIMVAGVLTEGLFNSKIQMSLLVYDILFFVVIFARLWIKKASHLVFYGVLILGQLVYEVVYRGDYTQISLGISGISLVVLTTYFYIVGIKKFGNYSVLLKNLMAEMEASRVKTDEQTRELLGMYEELEANDEEVRAQYQEIIENRDHLKLIQKRNCLLFKASNEVIWELDLKTGIRHFAEENYVDEVELDLIQSTRFEDWAYDLHPEDQRTFVAGMERVLNGESSFEVFEIRVNNLQGGWKWLRSKVVSLCDDAGNIIMMAGSYSDIDDRKQKERKIQDLAYHDQLTGLANRVSLLEHIKEHLLLEHEHQNCEGVFCYIDIDDFGSINNTYGHELGDQLIQKIAQRLLEDRPNDFIARIGGADFCVLSHESEFCESPELLAEHIQSSLVDFYMVDGKQIFLTASIGVTVYFEKGTTAETVIRRGDIALRQAKLVGKNRYCLFEASMSEAVSDRLLMGNELRKAVERDEMYLCFQPQINLSNGKIFGFEALLRWQSGRYGLVPPNRFIPLAEETGLIVPIGKWVFEKSCEFLAAVSTLDSEVMVSVNVAPQQLEQANFIEEISASVQRAGVKPEQLCIEVTESSVIASLSTALNQLEIIREAHLKIALDDFGTGFSSLNYLNQLPIDILKIDKSFTEKISNSSKEYLLIKSIMGLSSDLNLKLIMEGIETEAQLALIQDMGKPIIQGYYYGKPMSQSDALNYMLDYNDKESE